MPRDLITSTMKSEPVRSAVRTLRAAGVPTSASGDTGGSARGRESDAVRASANFGAAVSATAPAAVLIRKLRRFTDKLCGFLTADLARGLAHFYHTNLLRG